MRNAAARLGMFDDVRAILDAALAAGGGTYTLTTHGKAVHWRQRAYKFRKLFAERVDANSPYDRLILREIQPDSATVTIEVRETQGTFQPATNAAPVEVLDDDLVAQARAFAKRVAE